MACRVSDTPDPKKPPPSPICKGGKVYTDCKKTCETSCQYPKGEPGCENIHQSCKPGCECPPGILAIIALYSLQHFSLSSKFWLSPFFLNSLAWFQMKCWEKKALHLNLATWLHCADHLLNSTTRIAKWRRNCTFYGLSLLLPILVLLLLVYYCY